MTIISYDDVKPTRRKISESELPPEIRAEFARQEEEAKLKGSSVLEDFGPVEKREVSEDYVKEMLARAGKKLSIKS